METNFLSNLTNLYHYSIPNIKLFYPEPFISTFTFLNYDLWFIHVSIYQYWLWFFFIFIIVFFTVTFLSTLRWCSLRLRPQRETRGVSRSKCGDLITASVPATWAGSIIIHESTDTIDFYDGFGTTEMAVGIRAFQWGWEYYYPKDLDLDYNIKNSNNSFVGNSLNYNKSNADNSEFVTFFNYYRNKDSFDGVITPLHLLSSANGGIDSLNIYNSNNFGFSKLLIRNAFKSILSLKNINFDDHLNYDWQLKNNFFENYLKNKSLLNSSESKNYPVFSKYQNSYLSKNALNNFSRNFSNINTLKRFFKNSGVENQNSENYKILLKTNLNNFDNYLFKNSVKTLFKNSLIFEESDSQKNLNTQRDLFFENSFTNKYNNFNKNNYKFNISEKNYKLKNFIFKNYYEILLNKSLNKVSFENSTTNLKTVNNYQNLINNSSNFKTNFLNTSNGGFYKNINNDFLSNDIINYNINKNEGVVLSRPFIFNFKNLSFNDIKPNSLNKESFDILNSKNTTTSVFSQFLSSKIYMNKIAFEKIADNKSNYPYLYSDLDFKRLSLVELYEDLYFNFNNDFENNLKYKNTSKFYKKRLKYNYLFEGYYWKHDYNLKKNYNASNRRFFKFKNNLNYENYNSLELNNGNFNYSNVSSNQIGYFYNNLKFYEDLEFNFLTKKYWISLLSNYNINAVMFKINNSFITSDYLTYLQFFNDFEFMNLISENKFIKNFSTSNLNLKNNLNYLNNFKNINFLNKKESVNNNIFKFNTDFSKLESYKNLFKFNTTLDKVYKTYFDNQNSNFNFKDLSNSFEKIPFLTNQVPNFKRMLFKNKTNFSSNLIYKTNYDFLKFNNLNINKKLSNLNYFNFEFPFFLSIESDSARYMWLDWYSVSNRRVAKALDTNLYGIHGNRITNNDYDYSNNIEKFNTNENYLIKLSNARKLYSSSWTYSLFYLNKLKFWSNSVNLLEILNNFNELFVNYNKIKFINSYLKWYYKNDYDYNYEMDGFNVSLSNNLLPNRNYWRNTCSSSSYNYYVTGLTDIMIKREYLFRKFIQFLNIKKNEIPNTFFTSTNNPIILDFKSSIYKHSMVENKNEFFKLNSIKYITDLNDKFSNFKILKKISSNYDTNLPISQYKHMRKSVANMIRIQSDKAVAMPIDTRIQILTVSRDIVHSWAIPSAGIKIDCIPGYSSHKVTIFFLSGVYWGQCMEICGRFHHWMPIVAYFMKRDLFVLWCIHFILKNTQLKDIYQHSDRVDKDFLNVVSFNKNNWIN